MVLRKQSRVIRPVTKDLRKLFRNLLILDAQSEMPKFFGPPRFPSRKTKTNEVNSCLIDASFPHEDGVLIVVIVRWAYRDL